MTPDKIYALLYFDASFNSRFFKVENFLAAATVRMNALLGMELGEDDDSNGIGEIISGEVVKLLSVIAGTINSTLLSSDIERSDLNITWGNCIGGVRLPFYLANQSYYQEHDKMQVQINSIQGIVDGEEVNENFLLHIKSMLAYARNMYCLIVDSLKIKPTEEDDIEFAMLKENPMHFFDELIDY